MPDKVSQDAIVEGKRKKQKDKALKKKKKDKEAADLSFWILIRRLAKYRQCNQLLTGLITESGNIQSFQKANWLSDWQIHQKAFTDSLQSVIGTNLRDIFKTYPIKSRFLK